MPAPHLLPQQLAVGVAAVVEAIASRNEAVAERQCERQRQGPDQLR